MAENYKRILTDLYRMYQPDKLGEVDDLLRRFKGREKEMIYKIHLKYGSPETRRQAKEKLDLILSERETSASSESALPVVVNEELPEVGEAVEVRTRLNWRRIGFLLIALILVGGLTYAGWQLATGAWTPFAASSDVTDAGPAATPRFVLANAVHARTACNGSEKSDAILEYGASLSDYQVENACLKVSSDSGDAYYPGKYFVPEEVFREIDGIFGNEAARAQIKHSFEKRALRIWFRKNGVTGALSPEWKRKIAGPNRDPEVWQVYAEDEPAELNAWARGLFTRKNGHPARPEDLAVVITAPEEPSRQKLLLFSFDRNEEATVHPSIDLGKYPDRLIRTYPGEKDDWDRFFRRPNEYPDRQGILLEDPEGTRPDYLLMLENDRITVTEEVPRDTVRIPGLPPIIL